MGKNSNLHINPAAQTTARPPKRHATARPSPYQLHWLTWLLAFVTAGVLTFTIVYAWALSMTTGPLTKLVYPSTTGSLTVLRATSEITGILLGMLCVATLQIVFWAAASSDDGISLSSLLGISPSTGVTGLLYLLSWKSNTKDREFEEQESKSQLVIASGC